MEGMARHWVKIKVASFATTVATLSPLGRVFLRQEPCWRWAVFGFYPQKKLGC
jgi:hypothetical protein